MSFYPPQGVFTPYYESDEHQGTSASANTNSNMRLYQGHNLAYQHQNQTQQYNYGQMISSSSSAAYPHGTAAAATPTANNGAGAGPGYIAGGSVSAPVNAYTPTSVHATTNNNININNLAHADHWNFQQYQQAPVLYADSNANVTATRTVGGTFTASQYNASRAFELEDDLAFCPTLSEEDVGMKLTDSFGNGAGSGASSGAGRLMFPPTPGSSSSPHAAKASPLHGGYMMANSSFGVASTGSPMRAGGRYEGVRYV